MELEALRKGEKENALKLLQEVGASSVQLQQHCFSSRCWAHSLWIQHPSGSRMRPGTDICPMPVICGQPLPHGCTLIWLHSSLLLLALRFLGTKRWKSLWTLWAAEWEWPLAAGYSRPTNTGWGRGAACAKEELKKQTTRTCRSVKRISAAPKNPLIWVISLQQVGFCSSSRGFVAQPDMRKRLEHGEGGKSRRGEIRGEALS